MASFLYFCVYGYLLFVPGWLITRLLGMRRGRFLLTLALSYALLILNLIPMEWLRAPLWVFFLAFNLQVIILLAANLIMEYRRRGRLWNNPDSRMLCQLKPRSIYLRFLSHWWPPLAIMAGVCIYLAWAGPYLELSSDPWVHVERMLRARNANVIPGHFSPSGIGFISGSLLDFLTRQGGHWYILQALLCHWSGLAIPDVPGPLTLANTLVFCLSIYWFSMFLWSRQRLRRFRKIQVSLWTLGFTCLWLGISVFAYIRYYALAPAMLNYVLYLAVIVLMLDYFRARSWWGQALWLVPLLVAAMNVIHTQEALFACFIGLGMLLVMEGQWLCEWGKSKHQTPNVACRKIMEVSILPAGNMLKLHVLVVVGLGLFGLLFYYSLHRPMTAGCSDFILRPLFHGTWLGRTWFIQPLTGQFAQVVTWWGVLVYGLFLLNIRYFKRQPFILAGMLMPCLIVFNPLTLMILTRWVSDLNAIYRFNYMIPLPFVAGFLAMQFWVQIKSIPHWRGIGSASALLGLLVLLTPVETLVGRLSNSRLYTLMPVAEGNDHRRWGDLIAFFRDYPQAQVLTDPYTFQLLRRVDVHAHDGWWWMAPTAKKADRLALLRGLDRTRDWWLVINQRNGNFSMNGARSGHWGGDVWTHFSTAYPDDMLLFIKEHPELFKEMWSADQIQVYDIAESRIWE